MAKIWDLHRKQIGEDLAGTNLTWNSGTDQLDASGGSGAPDDAQYLTLAADATLTVERVFTPGDGLSGVDAGAGLAYTLNAITPGTLTVSTANSATASTHAITSSDNPGATASIVATASDGGLKLDHLEIGTAVSAASGELRIQGTTIAQQRILYDASNYALLGVTSAGLFGILASGGIVEFSGGFVDCNNSVGIQLRLTDSVSNVADFQVNSSGDLTITPSGDEITLEAQKVYINDTANANQTTGITIDQITADNEIITLQSSTEVAHGMTGQTETDTFGYAGKIAGLTGGLHWRGLSEDEIGLKLHGTMTNSDTSKAVTSVGAVQFFADQKSGTGITNLDANANGFVFTVRRNTADETVFIVDEDGDIHRDGGALTYDEFDDAKMIRLATLETSSSGVIETKYDKFIEYNREDLENVGLVSPDGFVNDSMMLRFNSGAIWEHEIQITELWNRILKLEERI